jgi:hypothetical protein
MRDRFGIHQQRRGRHVCNVASGHADAALVDIDHAKEARQHVEERPKIAQCSCAWVKGVGPQYKSAGPWLVSAQATRAPSEVVQ